MVRLVAAYAAFTVCEFGLWIAMLVYAYDHGGAQSAGLVAVAQLVPAAGTALVVAPTVERTSPVVVLVAGYAVQAAAAAVTATLLLVGAGPLAVYAGAAVASAAMAVTRPSQAALLPGLATHAAQLTACNVAIGWAENLGVLVSGAAVGVGLTFGSVGHVYATAAVVLACAAALVAGSRTRAGSGTAPPPAARRDAGSVWSHRPSRLLVPLLALESLVVGALDLLFVVMAVDVLAVGEAWTGYLNTAYGVGAVLLGTLGALLVGRQLGPAVVCCAAVLGLALGATTVAGLVGVVLLLAVVGGSRALFDMSVRVLLQRSVPPQLLARLFGLSEGLNMMFLAVGALLVPLLIRLGGPTLALTGTAALLPAVVLLRVGVLFRVDQEARLPVVEISLLQQIPLFRVLPSDALEALALSVEQVELAPGAILMREGERGQDYFAIADGAVEVQQRGRAIATLGRAEGLGEIALLRDTPRTATAVAAGRVTAFRLDRDSFLTAVLGHVPTRESADAVIRAHAARDAARDAVRDGSREAPETGL